MKKLFVFMALVGMGAYLAGCADSTPPSKPAGGPPATSGAKGGVEPGPKAGDAAKSGDKADEDMPDADKGDADKGDAADDADKPDTEKPDGDDAGDK